MTTANLQASLHSDAIIIGAGPVGLSLASALADLGLTIAVVERQAETALADPAFDGREIALTHGSMRLMRELGLWRHLPDSDIHPLRTARVMDGDSPDALVVDGHESGHEQLGTLVPNHRIRAAAWKAMRERHGITMYSEARIEHVATDADRAIVQLADGPELSARLLVAADSRFSQTRQALGIDADMHDFGKHMLICRLKHELPHDNVSWQWFGHRQTLAMLPLQEHLASAVLTVTGAEAKRLAALPDDDYAREMERRFDHRLGAMEVAGSRHTYPLVSVYARRFTGPRFALAGDAAVGMHPVTAHGFNFGLAGVERLAAAVRDSLAQHGDPAHPDLLARYERRHRRGTLPLFLATRGIVELYTNDEFPMQLVRKGALRASHRLLPFRRAIASGLIDDGPVDTSLLHKVRSGLRFLRPSIR